MLTYSPSGDYNKLYGTVSSESTVATIGCQQIVPLFRNPFADLSLSESEIAPLSITVLLFMR